MLNRPTHLKFPPVAEAVFHLVDRRVHADDVFFQGHDAHYLSVGASALQVIYTAIELARLDPVAKILDFGCGAGRVTRWLCAAFPKAGISVTDIRQSDMDFCVSTFGVTAWSSGLDVEALDAPERYDLIWAGSVLTHLPAAKSLNLLNRLLSWTRPGGLVVVSLHGRTAIDNQRRKVWAYLHDAGWQAIEREYRTTGYGYADYERQTDYGIAVTSLEWIAERVMEMPSVRLVLLSESIWDNHHDVLALQTGYEKIRPAT
jgi:trans-aconitate methyltransferase